MLLQRHLQDSLIYQRLVTSGEDMLRVASLDQGEQGLVGVVQDYLKAQEGVAVREARDWALPGAVSEVLDVARSAATLHGTHRQLAGHLVKAAEIVVAPVLDEGLVIDLGEMDGATEISQSSQHATLAGQPVVVPYIADGAHEQSLVRWLLRVHLVSMDALDASLQLCCSSSVSEAFGSMQVEVMGLKLVIQRWSKLNLTDRSGRPEMVLKFEAKVVAYAGRSIVDQMRCRID